MSEDSISVAAAILTAEFVRRDGLDQKAAVQEWRRIRRNMLKGLDRETAKAPTASQ